jgi:hypothetical protein
VLLLGLASTPTKKTKQRTQAGLEWIGYDGTDTYEDVVAAMGSGATPALAAVILGSATTTYREKDGVGEPVTHPNFFVLSLRLRKCATSLHELSVHNITTKGAQ